MTSVVFVLLLCISVWSAEGKWCVGWQRKAGENTPLLPCNFKEFDTDGNGHITEEEFMEVANGYGREGTGVVFAILDTNDDGIVLMEEFILNAHRLVNLHLMRSCVNGQGGQ